MPCSVLTAPLVAMGTARAAYETEYTSNVESTPMSLPRIHLNAVLLPDMTVFVSGGAMTH